MARKSNIIPPVDLQIGRYVVKGEDARDQLVLWYKLVDKRKKGTDEKTFRSIVSAILATRGHPGGFRLFLNDQPKEIAEGYKAVLKALTGELVERYHSLEIWRVKETAPKLSVVSTGQPNLRFSVQDKSRTVSWLNLDDVEPELLGLINGVKPVEINLPLLDLEFSYAWSHLNIPVTANNKDQIPEGLPTRYNKLEPLEDDLVKLGAIVSKDFVERMQSWLLRRGFVSLLVKCEGGAKLILPQTFELSVDNFWADYSLQIFRDMRIPQFIPVMSYPEGLRPDLIGTGRNISKEREIAAGILKESVA